MYDALVKYLEQRGFFTFFQNLDQLVISAGIPNLPTVNSFWVTQLKGQWYLSRWLPAVYRIPARVNVCDVCSKVLRSSQTALYSMNDLCVGQFGLERLSEQETDSIFCGFKLINSARQNSQRAAIA